MRKKISVIGADVQIARELARYADVGEDVRGADVVVLAGDGDLAAIRELAPAAAVLVTADPVAKRCEEVYSATLFPRARVIGIPDSTAVTAAAESIVFERGDAHEVIAMSDGKFGPRSARLGRGGISELL